MVSHMRRDVTAVIPTIPPRMKTSLPKALHSVATQTHRVAGISIAVDTERRGAWHTRGRALAGATTEWVAFLDDDDHWYPQHLERLLTTAEETNADYVFSYFDLGVNCAGRAGGHDPLGHFGRHFDPKNPHHTTMNVLVKRELAQSVGFTPPSDDSPVGDEDWRFVLGCVNAGAKIVHLPERTWSYNCYGNTAGLPRRVNWDTEMPARN